MKNKLNLVFRCTIIAVVLGIAACKKTDVVVPKVEQEAQQLKIEELKVFYANLIHGRKENIIYDAKTEMFLVSVNDKISKDQLTRIYHNLNTANR